MESERADMGTELSLALLIRFSGMVLLIGDQGDLGVNDHVLFFREVEQDIGLKALTVLVTMTGLNLILMAIAETGLFEQLFKLHLAPAASGLTVAL